MADLAGNLYKSTLTTYIPGDPGSPGSAGSPAVPAYCSASTPSTCGWVSVGTRTVTQWVCEVPPPPAPGSFYTGIGFTGAECAYVTTTYPAAPIWVCTEAIVGVCYPAAAAVPGTPASPATTSQTIVSLNSGWNTHSRTIGQLENGGYLKFTVDPSNRGFFAGVDTVGKDAQRMSLFDHGMLFDASGVQVYESGRVVASLGTYLGTTECRIERRTDETITYVAGTQRYVSTVRAPVDAELYVYGQLYSGGNRVLSASWESIGVDTILADATLTGAGTLFLGAPSVDGTFFVELTMSGAGSLSADNVVTDADGAIVGVGSAGWLGLGTGELKITPTYTNGLAYFPAVTAFGSELTDYMVGDSTFPMLTLTGDMYADYVPAVPTSGYGNLPFMASVGIVISVDFCQGDASFPALQAIGGDYAFGIGSASFPAMTAWGDEGVVGEMWMISNTYIGDAQYQQLELVLVIMSDGTLASVYTDSIVKVQEYISQLLVSSQFTLLGEYGIDYLSQLRAMSLQTQAVAGNAALDNVGRVWVVNMDSAASSQYDNYGFNSFFVRNGESYGVADDGIYRLTGATDLLEPIVAEVNLGSTRLNTTVDKRLPAVYINAASDGKLILKVEVDGSEPYYYEARSSSTELDNHRVDPGKGLRGNNWSLTLMNQDGDDFELANLEFVPLQGTRRI